MQSATQSGRSGSRAVTPVDLIARRPIARGVPSPQLDPVRRVARPESGSVLTVGRATVCEPWLFDLLRSSGLPTHVVGGTAMACSVGRPRASWKRAKARRGVGWILDHGSSAARRPFIRGWPNNGSIRLSFTSRPSLRSSVVPEKEMVAGSDQLSQPVGVGAPPAEVPRETCGRGH